TALTLGAGWRYTQTRSPGWAILTGAGLGLMFATKETFVLSVAAMFIAAAALPFLGRTGAPPVPAVASPAENPAPLPPSNSLTPAHPLSLRSLRSRIPWRDVALALG